MQASLCSGEGIAANAPEEFAAASAIFRAAEENIATDATT
jgi:hypothetical protein